MPHPYWREFFFMRGLRIHSQTLNLVTHARSREMEGGRDLRARLEYEKSSDAPICSCSQDLYPNFYCIQRQNNWDDSLRILKLHHVIITFFAQEATEGSSNLFPINKRGCTLSNFTLALYFETKSIETGPKKSRRHTPPGGLAGGRAALLLVDAHFGGRILTVGVVACRWPD